MTDKGKSLEDIEKRLRSIEIRLDKLEAAGKPDDKGKSIHTVSKESLETGLRVTEIVDDEEKGLESQIGQVGLAWLGNLVLFLGIVFLSEYLMNLGSRVVSVFLGYISAAIVFFISGYLKKSNTRLAFMFNITGQVLLFYITLRLHFFSTSPIIKSKTIAIILILLIIAVQVYNSVRKESQFFGILSIIFALCTALLSDSTHILLSIVTLSGAGAVYFLYRFGWKTQLILTIFLTYITFLLWILGNPVMGNPLGLVPVTDHGFIYLFCLSGCYSLIPLLRKRDGGDDEFYIGSVFVYGILFTLLLALVTVRFFSTGYVGFYATITIACLSYSVFLRSKTGWHFASAFYALYGFMAMTVSLYGLFGLPRVFLLLSVQSLLVVSMALWFRNKLIVIMNSLLFLAILSVYLLTSKSVDGVNFSFAFIPIISARIINWQKSRLEIRTELIRNVYLFEGFFMVLFALYHALPSHLVTLSWTFAALFYFLLSLILKNKKYRYMALGTMISAAIYLFAVDLAKIEAVYRVLAFLFLAVISIGISIYYTNRIKKSNK
jgi:hypothetical protein